MRRRPQGSPVTSKTPQAGAGVMHLVPTDLKRRLDTCEADCAGSSVGRGHERSSGGLRRFAVCAARDEAIVRKSACPDHSRALRAKESLRLATGHSRRARLRLSGRRRAKSEKCDRECDLGHRWFSRFGNIAGPSSVSSISDADRGRREYPIPAAPQPCLGAQRAHPHSCPRGTCNPERARPVFRPSRPGNHRPLSGSASPW